MRVMVTVLAMILGAIAGAAAGIGVTYWLLSGAEADAFTWLALGLFCCLIGIPLGAAVAFIALWRSRRA